MKMKRLFSLVLALVLVLSMVPLQARAEVVKSGTFGNNISWSLDEEGTLTLTGSGPMGITSQSVRPWHSWLSSVKKVVIGEGITDIGYYAFHGCTAMTSITIPDTVTRIRGYAFYNCKKLTKLALPDDITSIGEYAFYGCLALTTVDIPSNITAIEPYTFAECTGLEGRIVIPEGVTTIGERAFYGCGMSEVIFPDSLISIEQYAFYFSSINNVVIPEGITVISRASFGNNPRLKSMVIPASVVKIEYDGLSSAITDLCYGGTNAQWNSIQTAARTGLSDKVRIHYNNDGDHECDTCGRLVSKCNDANNDHMCDICKIVLTECGNDADRDHLCDICQTKTTCVDDDQDHLCELCNERLTDCEDSDSDHLCNTCGEKLTDCEDTDSDHLCNTCGEKLTDCEDTDNDHFCNTCGEKSTDCEDTDNDHFCNSCGERCSECTDVDDHLCDICEAHLSECADTDDHYCDICNSQLSYCDDADDNHFCDICNAKLSECDDTDDNHLCDMCRERISDCVDNNQDHYCDICMEFAPCTDADKDHLCDICDEAVGIHKPTENSHDCEYCGYPISQCSDANNNHNCDICGKKLSNCDDVDSNHLCDICGERVTACNDTDGDHLCEQCCEKVTDCADTDGDYLCDICGELQVPSKPYKIANVVSGVHVYWNAIPGITKYGLWRSENGKNGTYKWIANPTVPHFTDTKVESGKTYYYKITALKPDGKHTEKSEPISVIYVSTPDITSRINKAAGIQLGWNQVEGATGYAIYRKPYIGNKAWERVGTIVGGDVLSWTDESVKNTNGGSYKYTIRALVGTNLKTLSGCRNAGRSMVRLSSRVLNSAVKAGATSIKCSWTTSSAVTGYEVRFMVGSTVYKTFTIGSYKTGVKTFTGLPSGFTYKIQVRSYVKIDGMGFYSAWSTAKNVTLP